MKENNVISVFGSSSPAPGSVDYEQACELGLLLAKTGYSVATGGYAGTMAAVSHGASQVNGNVIGVTSKQIERSRQVRLNRWVTEEIKYETLAERVVHLVTHNIGIIVLPGGIGTLSEVALAWSFLQVGEIAARPLVFLGKMWPEMLGVFVHPEYVAAEHLAYISIVESPSDAVAAIQQGVVVENDFRLRI